MKTAVLFMVVLIPSLYGMDEESKTLNITAQIPLAHINPDLSIIVDKTIYHTVKDFVSMNPATSANMLLHLSLKLDTFQQSLISEKERVRSLKQQLKLTTHQLQEKNSEYELSIFQKEIEKTKKAREQFEQAKERVTSYKDFKKMWYSGLISLSYCAIGYGLLTLHNDACQNPSYTLLHQLICHPWG